jgi:fumarate hydratase class II
MSADRIERDSLGEIKVPRNALFAAQTQRAVENFPISGIKIPRALIHALGLIKKAAAAVNGDFKLLDKKISTAIQQAAMDVAQGKYDDHFPVDIFQTGSGTSSNMNANEVIATLASKITGEKIHPNDQVNMGQSSNDVIPTAIHIAAYLVTRKELLPSLKHLKRMIIKKAKKFELIIKTGRTHLMDAMPIRIGQEMSGWASQINHGIERISKSLPRMAELAQGGTAVGTGINSHPEFADRMAKKLSQLTDIPFKKSPNFFESISSQDTVAELSGQLKTLAISLMKISNDLRWMNSGPVTGLAEITLPSLQPGSSIMPGKINPVIPEAVAMVCAQVIGNDLTVTIGGQSGNFQLNVMLPVIAYNVLQSIQLLANASRVLADKAISGFKLNKEKMAELLDKNPILVTALNPIIGYDKAAQIAKIAYKEGRSIKEVALEQTNLSQQELDDILNPLKLTNSLS